MMAHESSVSEGFQILLAEHLAPRLVAMIFCPQRPCSPVMPDAFAISHASFEVSSNEQVRSFVKMDFGRVIAYLKLS